MKRFALIICCIFLYSLLFMQVGGAPFAYGGVDVQHHFPNTGKNRTNIFHASDCKTRSAVCRPTQEISICFSFSPAVCTDYCGAEDKIFILNKWEEPLVNSQSISCNSITGMKECLLEFVVHRIIKDRAPPTLQLVSASGNNTPVYIQSIFQI
ncbi:MAG TPA: hypothetical protein VM012_13370 [Flavitalea sp.]|nr:hypothetical protein [Flavitalea sp.]